MNEQPIPVKPPTCEHGFIGGRQCPECYERRRRIGIHGKFWGCENYPGCRGTRPIEFEVDADDPCESINERNARRKDEELNWRD